MTSSPNQTRYARVFDYASPYTSDAYAVDSGHGWDRLASIAGEYSRGEITWAQARTWCDDNARDMEERALMHKMNPDTLAPACGAESWDAAISWDNVTCTACLALRPAARHTLTDVTAGKSWEYESEAQLKTAARLYAFSHPAAAISITIGDQTFTVR